MVPGHEIAGIVAEVGSEVTKYAVGDRVGVGCFVDSCRECENCKAGDEQYCLKGEVADLQRQGLRRRAHLRRLLAVRSSSTRTTCWASPTASTLDVAAPLLCAGITLYSPLNHWGAGPGKKVAIVGLGGLGHMGVKIAAAMGAEVTVLSPDDVEGGGRQALRRRRTTTRPSDDETFEELAGTFDLIVNTVSAHLPMDTVPRACSASTARWCTSASPTSRDECQAFSLIGMRRSLAGSKIGGIRETQEMLDFCAEHGLGAEIEMIAADQIDEAWDRVVNSDVRYRFVIDVSTI